jgi:hypothetical protein
VIDTEIDKLTAAFPPAPLDPTSAFAEWGTTFLDAAKFRAAVAGKRWTELPAELLEYMHDALVFLGPSSIADYLPAYLASLLRRDPELSAMPGFLLGTLTRSAADADRFDARFARLTIAQRRAVASALVVYEAAVMGTPRREAVTAALDSYWRSQGEI